MSALAAAPFESWPRAGSIFILTTPEGAKLSSSASVEGFPLLVRLHKDYFPFGEAKANGEDIRFSTGTGVSLAYQIEEWDAAKGVASIWVRVPLIKGNERQEIRLHWGRADAVSESNGAAVFNESNGYLSVWHMNGPVKDEVGTLESEDVGTTATEGRVGLARHFSGKHGIFCGDKIPNYPVGAGSHSSEMWLRAEKPNGRTLAWGNEHGQGKVVMHFQSPPHVRMDCYFSGADVSSAGRMPMNEWVQVVHTYQQGDSRIYVDGVLGGVSTRPGAPLAIQTPARLFIGGWYHDYDFIGDIDEVRISRVARSADWVRLQYENQKAQQTLVGLVVPAGNTFAVSTTTATLREGQSATFTAQAGGALKLYWILKSDGQETTVSADRFSFTFDASRVTADKAVTLQCKTVYPTEVKTKEIAITIQEDIPEPVFTLTAPAAWDGRTPIEVIPQCGNLKAMQAKGAGELKTEWSVSPFAVIQETAPGKLILKRAQNSGTLTVTATMSNGGKAVTQSATIVVTEPKIDAWVARTPTKDEKPEDGQFYARDDTSEGTLYYNGTLDATADSIFLKVYADDKPYKTETATPAADKSYGFAVKLKPGLIQYKVEFGTKTGGEELVRQTVNNIVCGDAYLIEGQSNALATDTGENSPPETNAWIRSYGRPPDNANDALGNLWCNPVWKAQNGEKAELGWWGMELAKRLLESQKVPIFIINAAVGGTRIDQHQRQGADPTDLTTLYGRMLWRVKQAKLTHGIRGILWHQGESDQGADGPTGGYGWETYQQLFVKMSASWKQDFPNVQHYYVFQIWPDSCSMGGRNGSGDRLREKQRTLPQLYSHMSIISTLGVRPPGGCHFPLVGWAEFARLIQPLIERDNYGKISATSITPPNLLHASYAGDTNEAIALEFDQPVVWTDALAGQFYPDGEKGKVASGSVSGNVLTLRLKEASTAKKLTYLKETTWNQDTLLNGVNGLAALTFCDVPILSTKRTR
ncbi:MAG: DUF2341 domain-containing protein [Pedosphaera sp.]|nr:DUF2341 domain-containing protein [Pedosphaera sp.]